MSDAELVARLRRYFEARVARTEGCWYWTAGLDQYGYGVFNDLKVKRKAHRVAYELHKGAIPEGMTIDHLCRVRCCVNPDHLEVVTNKVNLARGESISALNARKRSCVHGHEFTVENTRWERDRHGLKRQCRRCDAIKKARRKANAMSGL